MKRLWALGIVLLATPASADRIEAGVTDVTAVTDGEGNTRILFRAGPTARMENVAVRRAWLRWATGSGETQRIALHVHAMGGEWSAGAASWNTSEALSLETYSRQEIELGGSPGGSPGRDAAGEGSAGRHGASADGFVLTVDPGEGAGLRSGAVDALGDLGQATLEVEYRRVPPMPLPGARDSSGALRRWATGPAVPSARQCGRPRSGARSRCRATRRGRTRRARPTPRCASPPRGVPRPACRTAAPRTSWRVSSTVAATPRANGSCVRPVVGFGARRGQRHLRALGERRPGRHRRRGHRVREQVQPLRQQRVHDTVQAARREVVPAVLQRIGHELRGSGTYGSPWPSTALPV